MNTPRILVGGHGADGSLPGTISSDGMVEAVKAALARGAARR